MANFEHTWEAAEEEIKIRITELHKYVSGPYDSYVCAHCSSLIEDPEGVIEYPCPTVKVLYCLLNF